MTKSDANPGKTLRTTLGKWLAISIVMVSTSVIGNPLALAQHEQESTGGNGTRLQGTRLQGTRLQGTRLQGELLSSGLAASMFVATLADGTQVELSGFRGDEVDATVGNGVQSAPVVLHAQELVGMTWYAPVCLQDVTVYCLDSWYRIASVSQDITNNTMPDHGSNSDVWLYQVEFTLDLAENTWYSVCEANPDGASPGIFVDGTWEDDGSWNSVGYTFACMDGVVTKCAHGWGYKPWATLTAADGTSVNLQPLHEACTRTARADYCGDGVTHTVDGLLVDIFDVYGFNVNERVNGFSEEASFDQYGAVSFRRARVVNHPNPMTCTSELPRNPPAGETSLLSVWSRPTVLAH